MSLHLVEHVRKRRLELECLLDLVRAHIRVFAVFKETRAMMLADELDERRRVGLPVRWEILRGFQRPYLAPKLAKIATASSVYLSKSVSKMP